MSALASYLAAKGHKSGQSNDSITTSGPTYFTASKRVIHDPPLPGVVRRESFPPPAPTPMDDRRRRSSSSYFMTETQNELEFSHTKAESFGGEKGVILTLPSVSPMPRSVSALDYVKRTTTPLQEAYDTYSTPTPVPYHPSSFRENSYSTLHNSPSSDGLIPARSLAVADIAKEGHLWVQIGQHWRWVYAIATYAHEEGVLQLYAHQNDSQCLKILELKQYKGIIVPERLPSSSSLIQHAGSVRYEFGLRGVGQDTWLAADSAIDRQYWLTTLQSIQPVTGNTSLTLEAQEPSLSTDDVGSVVRQMKDKIAELELAVTKLTQTNTELQNRAKKTTEQPMNSETIVSAVTSAVVQKMSEMRQDKMSVLQEELEASTESNEQHFSKLQFCLEGLTRVLSSHNSSMSTMSSKDVQENLTQQRQELDASLIHQLRSEMAKLTEKLRQQQDQIEKEVLDKVSQHLRCHSTEQQAIAESLRSAASRVEQTCDNLKEGINETQYSSKFDELARLTATNVQNVFDCMLEQQQASVTHEPHRSMEGYMETLLRAIDTRHEQTKKHLEDALAQFQEVSEKQGKDIQYLKVAQLEERDPKGALATRGSSLDSSSIDRPTKQMLVSMQDKIIHATKMTEYMLEAMSVSTGQSDTLQKQLNQHTTQATLIMENTTNALETLNSRLNQVESQMSNQRQHSDQWMQRISEQLSHLLLARSRSTDSLDLKENSIATEGKRGEEIAAGLADLKLQVAKTHETSTERIDNILQFFASIQSSQSELMTKINDMEGKNEQALMNFEKNLAQLDCHLESVSALEKSDKSSNLESLSDQVMNRLEELHSTMKSMKLPPSESLHDTVTSCAQHDGLPRAKSDSDLHSGDSMIKLATLHQDLSRREMRTAQALDSIQNTLSRIVEVTGIAHSL